MSYSKINSEDFVISSDSIVSPIWTSGNPTQINFFTSSVQSGSVTSKFYLDVYNTGSLLSGSEVQFSLSYGNVLGSGSQLYNSLINGKSPSSTVYGQFRTLVYGDENTNFNFGGLVTSSQDIFIIAFNRTRFKESLMPGSLKLSLKVGSTERTLTDNSLASNTVTYCDAGRIYDIVSGSQGSINTSVNSNGYTSASGSYGKLLPDVGLIILNPSALAAATGEGGLGMSLGRSTNVPSNNLPTLFRAINGSSGGFMINSQETISSDYIFVRIKNSEFNYTTNPSMISGSGDLVYSNFINYPQTYITTVGLYNDNNDLLAVAKLSKPLIKDFTKEALIRCKLDF